MFTFSISKFCNVALCFAIVVSAGNSWGQIMQQNDKPEPPPKNVALAYPVGELEAMTLEQLEAELEELTPGFRESLKAMWTAKARYTHARKADSYQYGKTWRENAIEGQKTYQKIKELSMEVYLKADEPTEEQFSLALGMALTSASEGRVGIANRVLKKMVKLRPDEEAVWTNAGRYSVFSDDYESANRLIKEKPKFLEELPRDEAILLANLELFTERWAKETAVRQAEAQADDLPRVELTTSKGKIVIELFENEAPHTVGNFIHLVETGFYKNALFHQVIRNFRAQVGLYFPVQRADGAFQTAFKPTDYEIVNESDADNAREILRGSVATIPKGSTAGAAEFSIYTAPNPFASDEYPETVFGRVISGMDVVDVLKVNSRFRKDAAVSERVNSKKGDMPDDYILSAKVLRKRPNVDYQPKKLPTSKK